MSGFLRLTLLSIALLAGSLAIACGGGGTSDGDDNGGDGPSGDGNAELREILEQFGVKEFKIVYNFTSNVDGAADTGGTMTFYVKPPDSWRMDSNFAGVDLITISSGGSTYICTSAGGLDTCLESPVEDSAAVPFLDVFTDPDGLIDLVDTSFGGVDVDRSDRTIAGLDASCFSVAGEIEDAAGSAEYCFGEGGLLLFASFGGSSAEGSGSFTIEATSVDDSVSDSDFDPPYDITEIPGLP